MFETQLHTRQKELREKITALEKEIKNLPPGKLLIVNNGKYTKWFLSNGSHPIYLPKKNRPMAEALAVKKFYLSQLTSYSQELSFLNSYQQHFPNCSNLSPDYDDLVASALPNYSSDLHTWMTEPFEHNLKHPEHLIHKTISGHFVRSKSENIIANTLFQNHIPYRYECELSLDNFTFHPDFTILHPITKDIFYWEHFGLIDQSGYSENAFQKLKIYSSHGIYPSINLITTYETADHPIDSIKIQHIVEEYFGSV